MTHSVHAQAESSEAYKRGVDAFRQGDYLSAQDYFQQAESLEQNSPTLIYNLGVTYFKLKHWHDSQAQFEQLAQILNWAPLATYHLGLLAEAEGKTEEAVEYFRAVLEHKVSIRLRQLATHHLNQVETPSDTLTRWFGVASMSLGYDDNAVFASDGVVATESAKEGDVYAIFFGNASHFISGDFSQGNRWDIGLFTKKYTDVSEFDYSSINSNIIHHQKIQH